MTTTTIPAVTLDRCTTVLAEMGISATNQGGDLLVWDDRLVSRSVTVEAASGFVEVTAIVWVGIEGPDDIGELLEEINTINAGSPLAGVELAAESSAIVTHLSTVAPYGLTDDQLKDFLVLATGEVNATVRRIEEVFSTRLLDRPVEAGEPSAKPAAGGPGSTGVIEPLSAARVAKWLENQEGFSFAVDGSGERFECDIDGIVIGIDCSGAPDLIGIQSPLRIEFACEEKTSALVLANSLSGMPLITAFATDGDDGAISVDVWAPVASIGGGYTDQQLHLVLAAAVKACFTAHEALAGYTDDEEVTDAAN